MNEDTLRRIEEGRIGKGDVLAVAQVAGIMAAKRTSDLIPMCHPLMLTGVDIRFRVFRNGDESWELPVTAVFVCDEDRRILYAWTESDYTRRPGSEELLAVLDGRS